MERDYGPSIWTDWDAEAGPPPVNYSHPGDEKSIAHDQRRFEAWARKRRFNKGKRTNGSHKFWYGPCDGAPITETIQDGIEVPFGGGRVAVYERYEDYGYRYVGEYNERERSDAPRTGASERGTSPQTNQPAER